MKPLLFVLALALLPFQYRIAAATSYPVLYVRSNGLASWPCGTNPSQPCKSIATAVANANVYATTTIRVATGDYAESINVTGSLPVPHPGPLSIEGGWNADFTSQSHDPSLTRITSSNNNAVINLNLSTFQLVDLRLAYLTLHGTTDLQRIGISASGNQSTIDLTLEQCRLTTYRGEAVSLYANNATDLTFTVDKSTIDGNYQWPTDTLWPGAGIYANLIAGSTGTITLTKDRIIDNQAVLGGGLFLSADGSTLNATMENDILAKNQASQGGGAIYFTTSGTSTATVYLTNNTIDNNTSTMTTMGAGINFISNDTSSLTTYLKNTIIWDPGLDIFMQQIGSSKDSVQADFSIIGEVDHSSGGTYTTASTDLNTDPLLNANYHLTSASPARDSGICGLDVFFYTRIAPYDDIDGDARPGFGIVHGCDIGADEYRFPWILYNPVFMKKTGKTG